MDKLKIIVLVAKSSAGKDNILNKVVELNPKVKTIVSYTSRPIRQGEIDGITYHYISNEKVNNMLANQEFIENRIYNTVNGKWVYGVGKSSFDLYSKNTYIVILDLQGLKQLENYLNENNKLDCLISIYIKASGQTRLLRSLQREGQLSDNQCKEICRRFISDEEDMEYAEGYCNITLVNEVEDDLNKCIEYVYHLTIN